MFVRRNLCSLGVVAAGVLLSAVIFTTLRSLELKNAQASFNGVSQKRLDDLETDVTLTLNNLISVGTLCDASLGLKRDRFDRFTARRLNSLSGELPIQNGQSGWPRRVLSGFLRCPLQRQ